MEMIITRQFKKDVEKELPRNLLHKLADLAEQL